MILQELIRNIVLYNGLIQPFVSSVKDYIVSFTGISYKQISTSSSDFEAEYPQKEVTYSFTTLTGTRTIPNQEMVTLDAFSGAKKEINLKYHEDSNLIISMLVDKEVANSAKTHSLAVYLCLHTPQQTVAAVDGTTTGSLIEDTNLFFSHETHGKREYLGEFSLSHEEIHF